MSCFFGLKVLIFIFSFFAYMITMPLILVWLLICAVIALIGLALPKKQLLINLENVKNKETICKVLNKKGLLSDEEYNFETNVVAPRYDQLTFCGYLFILNPVIYLLNNTYFADSFVLYLVHRWMEVHSFNRRCKQQTNTIFSSLVKVCVYIAHAVGQVLHRI